MPLGKSLSKVEKKASAGGKLNPRSRKMAQLARAQLRQDRLVGKAALRKRAGDHRLARLQFFQETLDGREEPLDIEETKEVVKLYLKRHDAELDELVKARQKNRPKSARQETLETLREAEHKEYITGFVLPSLDSKDNLVALKIWNGSAQTMHSIDLIMLSESGKLRQLKQETI